MKVFPRRNHNLHSKSTPGGLVHVPANRVTEVPDDVTDHPAFDDLVDSGELTVVSSETKAEEGKPVKEAFNPPSLPDEDSDLESESDKDNENEDDEDDEDDDQGKK